jgi:uncharacterized protein YrrD
MNPEQAGQELPTSDRLPQHINNGMTVYDREGQLLGTVEVVYFGGASETAVESSEHHARGFDADNVPEELRPRLMRQGYFILDGPDVMGAQRYILPEQIEGIFTQETEGVIKEAVRLRFSRDELLKP